MAEHSSAVCVSLRSDTEAAEQPEDGASEILVGDGATRAIPPTRCIIEEPEEAAEKLAPLESDTGRADTGDDGGREPVIAPTATLDTSAIRVGKTSQRSKKKKRSGKSGSGRATGQVSAAATGLEEFYADGPITPKEHEEEQGMYHSSRPVEHRILTAVQRWIARRKLVAEYRELFDRWLKYGGINTSANLFGATAEEELDDLTATERIERMATQSLSQVVTDGDVVVDFDGVMKGFLSCNSSTYFTSHADADVGKRIQIFRSFYNYLLHHNVCSEYRDQIEAAKNTLDLGESQLISLRKCSSMLPGPFNIGCSTLFGGWYRDSYNEAAGWGADGEVKETAMSKEQASTCFLAGFACHSSPEMVENYQQHGHKQEQPYSRLTTGLEVTGVEFADSQMAVLYKLPQYQAFRRVGKLKARTWISPAAYEEDLTEEEENERKEKGPSIKEYEFWVEEDILQTVFVGMKFEADVYKTTWGMYFFDQISGTSCSFFSWLPNDEMEGWREHVYLPPRATVEPSPLQVHFPEAS